MARLARQRSGTGIYHVIKESPLILKKPEVFNDFAEQTNNCTVSVIVASTTNFKRIL